MVPSKRCMKARTQPRNSRGQFAPVREVIYIDSDDSDFSSEVRVPRGKRVKGEPSTPIPAKKIKGEPLTPIPSFNDKNKVPYDSDEEDSFSFLDLEEQEDPVDSVKWLVETANNDAKKKLKRRTNKTSTRVDESFETLFVDIKFGVLEPFAQTKKGASVQKLRELFDGAKADAKNQVMSEAYKSCSELDEFFETLFVDVKYGVVKPLEEKKKKIKKK